MSSMTMTATLRGVGNKSIDRCLARQQQQQVNDNDNERNVETRESLHFSLNFK